MSESLDDSGKELQGLRNRDDPIHVHIIGAIPVPRVAIAGLAAWFLISLPIMVILGLYTHLAFSHASDVRESTEMMVKDVRERTESMVKEAEERSDSSARELRSELNVLEKHIKDNVSGHSSEIQKRTEEMVKEVRSELKIMGIDVENNKLHRLAQQGEKNNGPDSEEEN